MLTVLDCKELLKISQQRKISQTEKFRAKMHSMFGNIYVCSQQRKISQTERFRAKNALNVWKHICVREYIFYDEESQI